MSTTKDEWDGWHEVALGHLPEPTNNVILWSLSHGCVTGSWDGVSWRLAYGLKIKLIEGNVTHWRKLPEPPKPKDAFETWWDTLAPAEALGQEFRYAFGTHGILFKPATKLTWEAAINSTKQ